MILVSPEEIPRVITHLQTGGVVVYPTESSYGVGCMANNAAAVARVFELKERPIEKTVPLIVGSIDEAKRLIAWSSIAEKLAREHWPGPLTIVAPAIISPLIRGRLRGGGGDVQLAPGVIAPDGTIALRVSSHPVARALAEAVGPLVATSANRGGAPACFDVSCVASWLTNADGVLVIDAGALPRDLPSTLVRITDTGYEILRKGQAVV